MNLLDRGFRQLDYVPEGMTSSEIIMLSFRSYTCMWEIIDGLLLRIRTAAAIANNIRNSSQIRGAPSMRGKPVGRAFMFAVLLRNRT